MLLKSSCLFLLVTIPINVLVISVISFALVHLHFLYLPYDWLGFAVWLYSFGLPKQSHVGAANSPESNNRFCSSVLVKL